MILWGIIALAIIALDQITKYLVINNISASDTITAIKGIIDFVYVKNTGGAFSILNNATWLLSLISVVFCVGVIIYFIKAKPQNKNECAALTLMFAGAMGNAIDRIFRGFVIDFIKTSFVDFPVFNIADIAITVGAALLVIQIVFYDNSKEEK